MIFSILDTTAYLLPEYEKRSNEKKLDIAAGIGVSSASYYRMRKGNGSIRSNITDKALSMVYEKYPELVIESLSKRFYEDNPDSFCDAMVRLLPYERLIQIIEQKKKNDETYEMALSGYCEIYEQP